MISDIGRAVRTTRRAYNLTQEQLAELAGTSTRTIREIEHGSGSTSIGTVAAVLGALGLTLRADR
ncbi:helix-turn-helix domain-containing protein [Nocardia puris]|uniref:Y4mF family transcriptional regulator n=1 Tax=Nocardia puris TaxID=208602 RepID=A0A366DMU2_9NOCA|nr:helix-turn-helix domain-containing protein [Nocardia puris]RBO91410.1 y4mF family transcriptional regulator [Nocardia puris]